MARKKPNSFIMFIKFSFKLDYGFCKKSHRKDEPLTSFGWVQQVQQQTHPKVTTNVLKKVFNWSEVHLSEVTPYKIHNLVVPPL